MLDFTVAIPTYNGERRLPDVLEALKGQIGLDSINWEVMVIDNNSRDQTAEVVQQYQSHFPVPIRYFKELRQGAAYARDRAICESQSELVGFLDDDNIPSETWVASAYEFAQKYRGAGAIASRIFADFEVEPPPNFSRITPFLAITQRGTKPLLYLPQRRILPPSAGLVVRRQIWRNCVPDRLILRGRVEGSMLTGEDTEMLSYIQKSGWEIWYNPAMTLHHKIPKGRLERNYLIPFFRGIGLSRHVTRMLHVKPWQRPLMTLLHLMNDARKILIHLLKHRLKLRMDVVAASELQLLMGSFISPFYLWTKGYFKPTFPDCIQSDIDGSAMPLHH